MPTWPDTLPEIELDGYQEQEQSGAIRTDMDSGPAFQRQRFSATTTRISASITVTADQYATLKQFRNFDCAQGSIPFDWVHPITDEPVTMRFVVGNQLSISALGNDQYKVNLSLEILPRGNS